MADGTPLDGPVSLRQALTADPEQFVRVVTGKLLTYALGRGLEAYDMPTVRLIVRERGEGRLQVLRDHRRHREQPAVQDAHRAGAAHGHAYGGRSSDAGRAVAQPPPFRSARAPHFRVQRVAAARHR